MGAFYTRARVVFLLVVLLLAAPVAMAQSQSAPATPLRLVLRGYDPVAYLDRKSVV